MACNEASEFISALCDGEMIPSAVAEHIGDCATCQVTLRDYLSLGAELRRTASLEHPAHVPPLNWTRRRPPFTTLLQKGWRTMRIPRFAFAAMIAGIVVLASTLAVVKVGAHATGTVVLLNTAGPNGPLLVDCPLSTQDRYHATCGSYSRMNGKSTGIKVDLVNHETNRVELAIRTKVFGEPLGGASLSGIENEPEKLVWFEPGQPLKIVVPDLGTLTLTGEWMDHVPALIGSSNHELDPQADELRVVMPLLLKDRKVVGDLKVASATADKMGECILIYFPGEGLFVLSLSPVPGAVKAQVTMSRVSFAEGSHGYTFLTGVPVARGDQIWVLHEAAFKPSGQALRSAFMTSIALDKLPAM